MIDISLVKAFVIIVTPIERLYSQLYLADRSSTVNPLLPELCQYPVASAWVDRRNALGSH